MYIYKRTGLFYSKTAYRDFLLLLFIRLFVYHVSPRALCERVRRIIGGGRKSRENRRLLRRRRGRHASAGHTRGLAFDGVRRYGKFTAFSVVYAAAAVDVVVVTVIIIIIIIIIA